MFFFFLGIFTTRTTSGGAALGALSSIAVLAYVQNATPLNFMLYGAVGSTTCVVVGYLASLLVRNERDLTGLTWWTRAG